MSSSRFKDFRSPEPEAKSMPRWMTRQRESMRITRFGFCLMIFVSEKLLNVEITTTSVLSVLLLIYDYYDIRIMNQLD